MRNYYQSDCPRCGEQRNGRHRTDGCKVTDEMLGALRRFRLKHGIQWKSKLCRLWETQGMEVSDPDERSLLWQVRNTVGPRRLYKVKLGPNSEKLT